MTLDALIEQLTRIRSEKGNLPVICTLCSDYEPLESNAISVIQALKVKGSAGAWVMRDHPSISRTDARLHWCVHFDGN